MAALARDRDVLFVLDEVQGLRHGFGGEQGRLGLTPDLTLLGKIIGGGFPIGAVGGRADLLELTVAAMTPGYVTHAGTFNGHLAAAVAGAMTLRHLDAAAISRLNDATAALADRILAGAAAAGVPAEVTRAGSIMNVHLNEPSASGQLADLHLALLLHGVYTTPRGPAATSQAPGQAVGTERRPHLDAETHGERRQRGEQDQAGDGLCAVLPPGDPDHDVTAVRVALGRSPAPSAAGRCR